MRILSTIAPALVLLVFSTCIVAQKKIDRFALVNRHNVTINEVDPLSPLSVGNGDFAFTADITGLQSFEDYYHKNGIALETRTTWAWHSFPNPKSLRLQDAMKTEDFHGRKIPYASLEKSEAGVYYRQNPHPVAMGQVSLLSANGKALELSSISQVQQKLDVWQGLITSKYRINGTDVFVETTCHPERSLLAVKIKSPLLKSGIIRPAVRFPYTYDLNIKNKPPLDWSKPGQHQTTVIQQKPNGLV